MNRQPGPLWYRVLALELCLSIAAVGLCLGLSLRVVPTLMDKARGVQGILQAHDERHAWVERMAETGERPDEVALPWGLRPVWSPDEAGANLLWRCGSRRAPADRGSSAAPATEAASAAVYSICRESAVR